MSDVRYVLAVLVVTFLPPGIVWWYVVHPFVDQWRRIGPRGTLTVVALVMIAGVLALLEMRDTLVGSDLGTQPILIAAGALCLAGSIVIALARRKHLTLAILTGVPELRPRGEPGILLTEGVYAMTRNPRYIEIVLGTLGYALIANFTGAYVVTALLFPALHGIVLLEERELRDRFGAEFDDYCRTVPRYVPRQWRPPPSEPV